MTDTPLIPRDYDWHPKPLTPAYRSSTLRSPHQPLLRVEGQATELSGPTFSPDVIGSLDNNLIRNFSAAQGRDDDAIGPRIIVHGRVIDEDARPVPNTLIEIWQANAGGRYRHVNEGYIAPLDPNFGGCGRCLTDEDGQYRFMTIQPGAYPFPNGPNTWRPAHIHFSVFGEAFAQRLITQMYFEGDPLVPLCAIVNAINDPKAVDSLIGRLDMTASVPMDCLAYRFDIVLRGRGSTPFENRLEGN